MYMYKHIIIIGVCIYITMFLSHSPLDQFIIRNLFSIKADLLGNIQLSLTNIGLYLIITTTIIYFFFALTTNYNLTTPNN